MSPPPDERTPPQMKITLPVRPAALGEIIRHLADENGVTALRNTLTDRLTDAATRINALNEARAIYSRAGNDLTAARMSVKSGKDTRDAVNAAVHMRTLAEATCATARDVVNAWEAPQLTIADALTLAGILANRATFDHLSAEQRVFCAHMAAITIERIRALH